jgi:hypothetical protein
MAVDTILQHWIFTKFALPFLLIFFIVFAILEKTKVLGENKQINALVSFVIGLIFVSLAYPAEVVTNMVLFLTIALIVVFVTLMLWGFATGKDLKIDFLGSSGAKIAVGIVILFAVVIAVLWATGIKGGVVDLLFFQSWSSDFWINVIFVVAIAGALALVLRNGK